MAVTNPFAEPALFEFDDFSYTEVPNGMNAKSCFPFNVRCPIAKGWDNAEDNRLLVILDGVDAEDIKQKALCWTQSGLVLTTLLKEAKTYAAPFNKDNRRFKVAVANFQYFKNRHLGREEYRTAQSASLKRIWHIMDDLRPTHVIVLGVEPAKLITKDPNIFSKLGWALPITRTPELTSHVNIDSDDEEAIAEFQTPYSFHLIPSLDISRSFESGVIKGQGEAEVDEDENDTDEEEEDGENLGESKTDRELADFSNSLGIVYRHMATAYTVGQVAHPAGLPYGFVMRPKCVYIQTLEKFDKLMDMVEAHEGDIAVDTETRNLNQLDNTLFTVQIALNEKRGFLIPYLHPDSPWTDDEFDHVYARLRKFFAKTRPLNYNKDDDKILLMQRAQFDISRLRHALNIPIWYWQVWDTQAGEFCLDENIKILTTFSGNAKPYALNSILCRYGDDYFLKKQGFNKEDRDNIENFSLTDPSFQEYCAVDVQSLIHIKKCQMERASNLPAYRGNSSYLPNYRRLMLTIMSNLIKVLSHMEALGVSVDIANIMKQMDKNSEFNGLIKDLEQFFMSCKEVKQVNDNMVKAKGVPAKGLFGKSKVWLFDLSTSEHLQALFFDVMKLKPVSYGKNLRKNGEKQASVGKWFQEKYKELELMQNFTALQKAKKIRSAYLNSWYKKASQSEDGRIDGRLRPGWMYLNVLTGRGASSGPSLQQCPSRGPYAKIVKRNLAAGKGRLGLQADLSASEVKVWGVPSGDEAVAAAFLTGWKLRGQLSAAYARQDFEAGKQLKKDVKSKGDVHLANVKRFFGKDVDKSDPLRNAVKAVVFGVLKTYGSRPE